MDVPPAKGLDEACAWLRKAALTPFPPVTKSEQDYGHGRNKARTKAKLIRGFPSSHADNQNISFLPAIMTTSSRMHGEFLRLLYLQALRETTAHFIDTGLPSLHCHWSDDDSRCLVHDCHRNKTDRTTRSGSNARHSTWA